MSHSGVFLRKYIHFFIVVPIVMCVGKNCSIDLILAQGKKTWVRHLMIIHHRDDIATTELTTYAFLPILAFSDSLIVCLSFMLQAL